MTEEHVKLSEAVVERKLGPEVSAAQTRLLSTNKVEAFHLYAQGPSQVQNIQRVFLGKVAFSRLQWECWTSELFCSCNRKTKIQNTSGTTVISKRKRYVQKQRKIDLKIFFTITNLCLF